MVFLMLVLEQVLSVMSMTINYILNFTSDWKDISNIHSEKVYLILKLQRQSSSTESRSLTISIEDNTINTRSSLVPIP